MTWKYHRFIPSGLRYLPPGSGRESSDPAHLAVFDTESDKTVAPAVSLHRLALAISRCLALLAAVGVVSVTQATIVWAAGPQWIGPPMLHAAQVAGQFNIRDQSDLESSFFLPVPREDRLRLDRIEEAAADERWTDAAQDLIDVLAAKDTEDFLAPLAANEGTIAASVKTNALKLVQSLPPEVLEAYQLLVGRDPEVMLEEALTAQDEKKLAEVARRFLFTPSGEKATVILARKAMDARQWEGALLNLRRLEYIPGSSRQFRDEAAMMRAICLTEVGQPAGAETLVQQLKDSGSLQQLLRNQNLNSNASPAEILKGLAQSGSRSEFPPYAWTMFHGSASRTAPSRGSEPLQEIQWNARMAQSHQQQEEIRASLQRFRDNRLPVFPVVQPVVVLQQVIFRTPAGLLATDIDSGKVLWKFPWDTLELDLSQQDSDLLTNIFPGLGRAFERSIWADARSGHLSSDGQRVFYVHDETTAHDDLGLILSNRGFGGSGGLLARASNRLYCFDLEREGAILWQIGGPGGGDNESDQSLSQARFLGPPLPVDKDLYVLAGIIDEVRLLCLDPETGQVQWSQQLARQTTTSPMDVLTSFMQAATPSHKGGVLICPTNSGAIVAIDLSNRTLLWGHQYKEPNRSRAGRRNLGRDQSTDFLAFSDRWTDGTPFIHQGKVLVTPTDSDYLYCLDLLTGEKLWELPRREAIALVTVEDGIALVAGKNSVVGIDIQTGAPAWEIEQSVLPEKALPSGYGFRLNGKYYLPTTANQIVPIDLRSGKQGEPIPAVGELGNLVCYQDYVISVSPEYVTAYKQIDALRREVDARLVNDPRDAEALRMRGKLQKHDGDLAGALESLRLSMEVEPTEEARSQLVATGLAALQNDFATFHDVVNDLAPLTETADERMALARLTAQGLQQNGQHQEALEHYLRFLDLSDQHLSTQIAAGNMLMRHFDPQVEVTADRWARGRIDQIREAMPPEQRSEAEENIQERLSAIEEGTENERQRLYRFVQRFPRFSAATSARVRLARLLLEEGEILRGETLVRWLLSEDLPPETLGPLIFQLAEGLSDSGLPLESAAWYRRLANEFSNIPVQGTRTGRQVVALKQWDEMGKAVIRQQQVWPYSETSVEVETLPETTLSRVDFPIRLKEQNSLAPTGYSLLLETDAPLIIVRDRFGNPVVRIPFKTQSERKLYQPQIGALHAQQFGHLLILSLGSELQALNMLPQLSSDDSSRLVWQVDLQHGLPGSSRGRREFEARPKRSNPFADMGRSARDVNTQRLIGQFAGSEELVCYQIGSRLVCRHPLTGEIYWQRDGVDLGCELIVFDRYVIATPGHKQDENVTALVLSADNGELIRTIELPNAERIWTTCDRTIVAWRSSDEGKTHVLEGVDATSGDQLWALSMDAVVGTQGALLENRPWVALLDNTGELRVIDLRDGQVVHQRDLKRTGNVVKLKVVETDDQFLVAVYRDIHPRPHHRSIPYNQSETLLRGELYAFDFESGKMVWDQPALVHDNFLLESFQSSGLPVIAMAARLHRPNARTPQMSSPLETVIIDRRDGRVLFRQEFEEASPTFSLTGDPSQAHIQLELARQRINVKFHPQMPPPPAPPANTEPEFTFPASAVKGAD